MKQGDKFRIKIQKTGDPRREDCDIVYRLVGKKAHSEFCLKPSIKLAGKREFTCVCPVESDAIGLECPNCKGELFLQLKDGPFHKEVPNAQVFEAEGDPDLITIRPVIGCVYCFSAYEVTRGTVFYLGEMDLPKAKASDLTAIDARFLEEVKTKGDL